MKEGYGETEIGTIPTGWDFVKLGDILIEGRLGGNYSNGEKESGLPLIKMGNIRRGSIDLKKVEFIPTNEVYQDQDILKEGDLLLNTRNTLELVGKVAIWKNELDLALFNSNLMRMTFDQRKIASNYYMNYVFNSKYCVEQLRNIATGTTSVAAIYTKDLVKLKIALPSLAEQTKIATILSIVDDKINAITDKITATQQLKNGLMQRLLTKGIGHTKFKDSRIGEIPESWVTVKLGENLEKVVGGGTPSRNIESYWQGNVPWATVKDLKRSILHETEEHITEVGLKNSASNLIPRWTIIIATRMALGKAVFFTKDVAINQDLKAIFTKPLLDKAFLFHWFAFNAKKIEELGSGSTVKGIRLEVLHAIDMALPSISEQQKISEILSKFDEKLVVLEDKKTQYDQLKQGMMQTLLTGKIRVKMN